MGWSINRRLEFIDFRLYWEGRINRKDLKEFFDISIPQASADIRKYQEKAPNNIQYDKSQKFYYATEQFKPIFTSSDSDHYFAQLRHIASDTLQEEETFLGHIPSFDTIPNISRKVDSEVLRKILYAVNNKMSVEIKYQSMSRDQAIWRSVTPHTLSYDGFRWHFRAYCYTRKMFLDFLFARIHKIGKSKPDPIDASADVFWYKFLELKIAPHPDLTDTQKKIIESDYGMKNGIGTIKVRAAHYFYLKRKLLLDERCSAWPAKEQQIILVNRDEVEGLCDHYSQSTKHESNVCRL